MFKNLAEVDNIVKNGSSEDLEKLLADWKAYEAEHYSKDDYEDVEEEDTEDYEEEEEENGWEEDEDYLRCISVYGDDRDPEIIY